MRRTAKKTTIYTLSQEAGVSPATISKALRNSSEISLEMRQKIGRLAKKHNYQPRHYSSPIPNICALVQRTSEPPFAFMPYITEVLQGMSDYAQENNVELSLFLAPVDQLNRYDLVREMGRRCVNGVVVFESTPESRYFDQLDEQDFPYCSVFKNDGRHVNRFLAVDTKMVGYQATQHLLSLGHRRIGVLATSLTQKPTRLKLAGYRQALMEANREFDEGLVFSLDHEESATEFGREATEYLLRLNPDITAIFCMSENIALGALHGLHVLDIPIPADISVISCGDFLPMKYLSPPVTVIEMPFSRIGYLAMRKVHCLLTDMADSDVNGNIILKGRLIERASVASPRQGLLKIS